MYTRKKIKAYQIFMKIASGKQHCVQMSYNKCNLNRAKKVEFRTETSLRTQLKYDFYCRAFGKTLGH
jgi:hypothetical protein